MANEAPEDIEWTDEERAALDALGRETDPGRPLEERTVRALRREGLLAPPPRRPGERPEGRTAWWVAGVAAALALFLGGTVVGQWRAEAAARDVAVALRAADAEERAALVQRTGSLWVEALAGLGELQARGDEEEVATAVEVARAALLAATAELARLHPEDAGYARIVRALSTPVATPATDSTRVRQVLWF